MISFEAFVQEDEETIDNICEFIRTPVEQMNQDYLFEFIDQLDSFYEFSERALAAMRARTRGTHGTPLNAARDRLRVLKRSALNKNHGKIYNSTIGKMKGALEKGIEKADATHKLSRKVVGKITDIGVGRNVNKLKNSGKKLVKYRKNVEHANIFR